jgi:hypothetical protein
MAVFQIKHPSSRQGASQNVSPAGSSAASTAFGSETFQIMVVTTTSGITIRIGDGTPTAVATDTLLPVNIPLYFTVTPGQKLAALGTGTVSVTELS